MPITERAWWPGADALARLGHTVMVFDPEATAEVERFWDEVDGHGSIVVYSAPHLTGWRVEFSEEVVELDSALLEMIYDLDVDVLDEDDGEIG